MKMSASKNHSQTAINLVAAIKKWEDNGNEISNSDMFYYCPWFTGKKDNQYKKVA